MICVSLITFLLMHAIPGSPWNDYANSVHMMHSLGIDKPVERELARRFGLDLLLWRQFTRYLIGDFDRDGSFFLRDDLRKSGALPPAARSRRARGPV
jgi:ABC-type dipeptide/oligopeptide/nickel transport system permease component